MYGLALKHRMLLNLKAYKAYTYEQTFPHILQHGLYGGMEVLFIYKDIWMCDTTCIKYEWMDTVKTTFEFPESEDKNLSQYQWCWPNNTEGKPDLLMMEWTHD